MSTRIPALVRFTARTTLAASARLPVSVQWGKLQAHEDAERLCEIAQPGETLGRPLAVRIRHLRDDVPRAELGGRFELRNERLGLERGIHAKELDVQHGQAG
jgi:hypothetical protein